MILDRLRLLPAITFIATTIAGSATYGQTPLRVATWNVESVGEMGELEYTAALAVLGRINADVIGINEINGAGEVQDMEDLADDAGYPYVFIASSNAFGPDRNAILSKFPFVETVENTSESLSGDIGAFDISRIIIEATVDVPNNSNDLTIVINHWKSGTSNGDEFRRVVDSFRTAQAVADLDTNTDAYILMGDVNEELDNVPQFPSVITSVPGGFPGSYILGSDVSAMLPTPGLDNDPFHFMQADAGTTAADALQLDGLDGTRPSSNRRLDYLMMSQALINEGYQAEVYDSQDEGLGGGLTKYGAPLAASTSEDASDHFMVFADINIPAATANAWINEIHYDNDSTDVNEGVEIAGEAGIDLTDWKVYAHNGSNGARYDTETLTGTIPDFGAGFGTIWFPISGLQNGSPDGLALVDDTGEVVQFLSYEGDFVASNGPASGLMSEDIGVSETTSTPAGQSLQLEGTGTSYNDFTWTAPATHTRDATNNNQVFGTPCITDGDCQDGVFCNGSEVCNAGMCEAGTPPCPADCDEMAGSCAFDDPWINEIHYDNDSTDTDEGVEIAGPAGLDLADFTIYGYNGGNGATYFSESLSGVIPDQDNGFGTVWFAISGLQNGSPDGLALVDGEGNVIEFISYEGVIVANGGPADTQSSTDILVEETTSTPAGLSLQLQGNGTAGKDFTWAAPAAHTRGLVNTNQAFMDGCNTDADCDDGLYCNGIEMCMNGACVAGAAPCGGFECDDDIDACYEAADPFINEIHYDNVSTDKSEIVEIAGTVGTVLDGYTVYAYNGNGGAFYRTYAVEGTIESEGGCMGTLLVKTSGLQNGPDGVALVDTGGNVVEFVSYEGSFQATDGPANGMMSTDIGVSESASTPVGYSLQRTGQGGEAGDFSWHGETPDTPNAVNNGQTFDACIP